MNTSCYVKVCSAHQKTWNDWGLRYTVFIWLISQCEHDTWIGRTSFRGYSCIPNNNEYQQNLMKIGIKNIYSKCHTYKLLQKSPPHINPLFKLLCPRWIGQKSLKTNNWKERHIVALYENMTISIKRFEGDALFSVIHLKT